jgi:uncharacterized protein YndB with AHSA1/START domain
MKEATIVTEGARPSVRLERHLDDPPSVVWGALTEREQLHAWFPCDVIVDGGQWVVGAAISFPFDPKVIDMTLLGEVLEVEKPYRLAFSWGSDILRFELSDSGGGTDLVLFDELDRSSAARNAAGWDECLDRLVGLSAAPDAWQGYFDHYRSEFEPVLGPQEGIPEGYKGK